MAYVGGGRPMRWDIFPNAKLSQMTLELPL
jgi:hypothetical protein